MIPKRGGAALDPAPDCLPGEHHKALRYLKAIETALGQHGWTARQRIRLRSQFRKWILRAEGRDPYFEKYGTFPRPEGAPPPTGIDLVVAAWRRRVGPTLTAEDRKRRSMPSRLRQRYR